MSYFCSGDRLVRDMWPPNLAKHMDVALDKDEMAGWAVVPDTFDGACSWAVVMPLEEGRPNESTLLYDAHDGPSSDGSPVRVTVVVHGVVESINLRPLGNYKGLVQAASRAVQYITLSGGPWQEVFAAQVNSLNCIRAFVGSVFGVEVADAAHNADTIHFHRPVFTPAQTAGVHSLLRRGDDPQGFATAISRQWVVGHRVQVGIAGAGRASATCVRKGDFVAVAACIDIVKTYRGKQWKSELRLSMREVSRIMSVDALAELLPKVPKPEIPAVVRTRPLELLVLGCESDEEDDEHGQQKMEGVRASTAA